MHRGPTGRTRPVSSLGGETVKAFVPHPLPPEPPLDLSGARLDLLLEAHGAVCRLDGASSILRDHNLFLYLYVRKEAVLSSQIEGTRSTLSDLLLYEVEEAPGVPLDDVREVSCYVRALDHGVSRLREGLPLSNRLLKEVHGILLSSGRGASKEPGEFRRSQNWINGTRPGRAEFVPPPHDELAECMGALERFLHDDPGPTQPLVKAALAHVQFETIHPFLDGNGRVGRLLVPLLLCAQGVLREPLLYLSVYLRKHRRTYFELLQSVRRDGDWEAWLDFFLEGVRATADSAAAAARALTDLAEADRARIAQLGRPARSALLVHDQLQRRPVAKVKPLALATQLSEPTVISSLRRLEDLGVVHELTGGSRNLVYAYARYLEILNEGTEQGTED
ncbi:Adenosine monophosphate-protein transferase SoFic [Planctomycetes bacterium Pla163]|uniref:Adenosine monophosphate-protein transferase SoFic n=1 Tax=Rohdeia mirabilis TaxID=2528008 RepID=A0A518CVC1_9BACT|nr:Adenosine monophosphate-protein transferase SoFic [Planctomycetes bacterium Pla163]